jgi:hypothetical protein
MSDDLPQPGQEAVTDPPPGAEGAVERIVYWADAEGRATDDRAQVASITVVYLDEHSSPVLTVYGYPPPPEGG